MTEKVETIKVTNNPANCRYEAVVDGHLAVAEYKLKGEHILFTHTEVPDELEGQGIGGQLVKAALEDARRQHLSVVPLCQFVRSYIKRHREYLDLLESQAVNKYINPV